MDLSRGRGAAAIAAALLSLAAWQCGGGQSGDGESGDGDRIVVRFDSASADGVDAGEVVEVVGVGAAELRDLERREPSGEQWASLFPVWVGDSPPSEGEDRPTVLGSYSVREGAIRFEPRFPLVPGESYHAVWLDPDSGREMARATLRLPPVAGTDAARVTAIFPSASELPENLLRFYVHFSTAMSREHAASHIRLVGPDGAVERPFVAIEHELWNPTRDRLTLIMDPGRVKRGVGPNLEQGPVLSRGGEFRLEVRAGWPDGSGGELGEGFRKVFRVVEPDRRAPAPEGWEVVSPSSPEDAVTLSFTESLDHGLLHSALRVETDRGEPIDGDVEVGIEERSWVFSPLEPWSGGPFRIVVDPSLEDPAGNSVRRVFDSRQAELVGAGESREPVVLGFDLDPQNAAVRAGAPEAPSGH